MVAELLPLTPVIRLMSREQMPAIDCAICGVLTSPGTES